MSQIDRADLRARPGAAAHLAHGLRETRGPAAQPRSHLREIRETTEQAGRGPCEIRETTGPAGNGLRERRGAPGSLQRDQEKSVHCGHGRCLLDHHPLGAAAPAEVQKAHDREPMAGHTRCSGRVGIVFLEEQERQTESRTARFDAPRQHRAVECIEANAAPRPHIRMDEIYCNTSHAHYALSCVLDCHERQAKNHVLTAMS